MSLRSDYSEGLKDGYEQAREELRLLIAKAPLGVYAIDGDIGMSMQLSIVLAWLGVDPALQPIMGTGTKGETEDE